MFSTSAPVLCAEAEAFVRRQRWTSPHEGRGELDSLADEAVEEELVREQLKGYGVE